jgi:hypothetical protein
MGYIPHVKISWIQLECSVSATEDGQTAKPRLDRKPVIMNETIFKCGFILFLKLKKPAGLSGSRILENSAAWQHGPTGLSPCGTPDQVI